MSIKPARYAAARAAGAPIPWDIVQLAAGGAIILALLVLLGDQFAVLLPFRAIMGAIYILFVPGFFLTLALFPQRGDLDTPARLGLSFGLSLAVVPLLALLLDRLPWGIRAVPILIAEGAVIVLALAIGIWRGARLPAGAAYQPQLGWQPRRWWSALGASERRTYGWLGGALLLAGLAIGWIFLVPTPGEYMTEFYMLGKAGLAEDYPQRAALGDELSVTIGVKNLERAAQTYRVEAWATDRWNPDRRAQLAQGVPLTLATGQEQQLPISWRMPWAGPDQHVELLLFREGETQPYRHLHLWVNVE